MAQSRWKCVFAACFVLGDWFGIGAKEDRVVSRPAEQKSILEEQIGAVYDVYPTDPNQQVIVRLMEAAFREDPRQPNSRPAAWIDRVRDTQPAAPPDLRTLAPAVLFHDAKLANAHWKDFRVRCPLTSKFFIKEKLTPRIQVMPGDVDAERFIANIHDLVRVNQRELEFVGDAEVETAKPAERARTLQEFLNLLVMVDYLYAHGGEVGKVYGYKLTRLVRMCISDLHWITVDHVQFEQRILLELIWPHLALDKGRYRERDFRALVSAFPSRPMSKEKMWIMKWGINHKVDCANDFRDLCLVHRSNAYGVANDYGGLLVLQHVLHPAGDSQLIEKAFLQRFGDHDGRIKYAEYLKALGK
jgi:hypothetical protein